MTLALPFVRWGTGERRALLVHGLTSSARVWWRVGSELADRGWEVTAVDLRGHGAAPPASRYALADFAADLEGFGQEWDVVVGHSLGADAVVVATSDAGWADRLVLVDPVLSVPQMDRSDLLLGLLQELRATADELAVRNPAWDPDDVFWKVWSAQQCSPAVVERVMADNDPWDVSDRLADVPVPCMVLAGDPTRGAMTDAEAVRAMSLENPRIHLVELDGVGHSIFRDQPDVVVRAVEG